MAKTIRTPKGSELPLLNLKGKDYLMVAYRLQWLTEQEPFYTINTEFLKVDDEQTVAKATITIFNDQGKVVRSATATKRETKKDFPDHTEKAETAACGRALSMLGFGTQHALSDLDEGARIVDSPLQDVKAKPTPAAPQPEEATPAEAPKKVATFRRPKAESTPAPQSDDGWE